MKKRPAVGVAVIIVKDKKVLLGRRKNAHGHGTWAFPGGHLEMNESIADCARREVKEETGLLIEEIEHIAFTNDIFQQEQKHYVTLFVRASGVTGEPELKEPEKCDMWQWFSPHRLPQSLFLSLKNLIIQEGLKPFDE